MDCKGGLRQGEAERERIQDSLETVAQVLRFLFRNYIDEIEEQ